MDGYKQVTPEDIENLKIICSGERVFTGAEINEDFYHDEMPEYGKFMPEAVIEALDTDEISRIIDRKSVV